MSTATQAVAMLAAIWRNVIHPVESFDLTGFSLPHYTGVTGQLACRDERSLSVSSNNKGSISGMTTSRQA